jgi:hypothetical protein
MSTAPKTAAAVDAAIEAAQEAPHRGHLGASVIGKPCSRQLWYDFHWTQGERHPAKLLRLFERGQLEEKRFVGWLRAAGITIWEVDPETGKQFRVSDCEGHFGGSLDGVGQGLPDLPADEAFVTEFKTHGDRSFSKLKEDGLLKAKWEHYVQMNVYMGKMELKWALYVAINKDTDELFFELIQFNPKVYQDALNKAAVIVWSVVPPARIAEMPSNPACKFCHVQKLCHFGGVTPDRNCRTCVHSKPSGDGMWQCTNGQVRDLGNDWRNQQMQRDGCDHYEVNPLLTTRAK